MSLTVDLVQSSKLETFFDEGFIVHTIFDPDGVRSQRWRRDTLIEPIGFGASGNIWLEHCVEGYSSQRIRAVKQIRTRLGPNRKLDCNRELEAVARFSSPKYAQCFVESFGWYEDTDCLYIAMEYLGLGDLGTYMEEQPPIAEEECRAIILQISQGANYLHDNGVAHRDMKPSNILLRSRPPHPWWVKIGDFGISKQVETANGASTLLKGTMGFVAPELHDLTPVGSVYATDMWSIGEITFQMAIKRPTFPSLGLLVRYIDGTAEFPSNTLGSFSISGLSFVQSLMKAKPFDRLVAGLALKHEWLTGNDCSPISPTVSHMSGSFGSATSSTTSSLVSSRRQYAAWSTTGSNGTTAIPEEPSLDDEPELAASSSLPDLAQLDLEDENTLPPTSINIPRQSLGMSSSRIFRTGQGKLVCTALSSDGTRMATSGSDGSIKIWDVSQALVLESFNQERSLVATGLAFSPMDNILVCSCNAGIFAWYDHNKHEIRPTRRWPETNRDLRRLTFSPDGSMLAAICKDDGVIRIWDYPNGTLRHSISTGEPNVNYQSITFSPDSKLLATGLPDFNHRPTLHVWNTVTGRSMFVVDGIVQYGRIAFHPDSQRLGIPNMGGFTVCDVKNKGSTTARLDKPFKKDDVEFLAWLADDQLVVAGTKRTYMRPTRDGFACLYSLKDKKSVDTRRQTFPTGVSDVIGTQDGNMIAFRVGNDWDMWQRSQ